MDQEKKAPATSVSRALIFKPQKIKTVFKITSKHLIRQRKIIAFAIASPDKQMSHFFIGFENSVHKR